MTPTKPADLKLADVISLGYDGYSTATVEKIDEDSVTVVRPYIHTADFSYTGGVITYIGQERFRLSKLDARPVNLVERKELK